MENHRKKLSEVILFLKNEEKKEENSKYSLGSNSNIKCLSLLRQVSEITCFLRLLIISKMKVSEGWGRE